MKCLLPSFVTDFVQVISWVILDGDESTEINISQENLGKSLQIVEDKKFLENPFHPL